MNLFKRKPQPPKLPFPLVFKDAVAAIEYASAYMDCKLVAGNALPAVVLDATEMFGAPAPVQITPDGFQSVLLKVCGEKGGFLAFSQTSGKVGPALKPGDLVSWHPMQYVPEMGRKTSDHRTGWVGITTGVLAPTLTAEGWMGVERFRD